MTFACKFMDSRLLHYSLHANYTLCTCTVLDLPSFMIVLSQKCNRNFIIHQTKYDNLFKYAVYT